MGEWLGREWWQYVWIPIFGSAVGLIGVLISRSKNRDESESKREEALDGRQERWILTQAAEIKEQRTLIGEQQMRIRKLDELLNWWWQKAHALRHEIWNTQQRADSNARLAGIDAFKWPSVPDLPPRDNPQLKGE